MGDPVPPGHLEHEDDEDKAEEDVEPGEGEADVEHLLQKIMDQDS